MEENLAQERKEEPKPQPAFEDRMADDTRSKGPSFGGDGFRLRQRSADERNDNKNPGPCRRATVV